MNAVSILLNLTDRLSFEETDPFLSLVSGKGPLLYYDQLSVKRFPSEKDQYDNYLDNLLSDMRNLLESRGLSREDRGERIRLIVIVDLAGGLFEPREKGRKCFPAQKVRLFHDRMRRVFGDGNPLLGRFVFSFIFLESTAPEEKHLSAFYRTYAFDGYTGEGDWLRPVDFSVGGLREDAIKQIEEPDEDRQIDEPAIAPIIESFVKLMDERVRRVAEFLEQLGIGDIFVERVQQKRKYIRSLRDFREMDYDGLLRSSVRDLIGLASPDFERDCSFFIMKYNDSPLALKRKDEFTLKSLIQLLVTVSDEKDNRGRLWKEAGQSPEPSVFVLGNVADEDIDRERLQRLHQVVLLCRKKLREGGDLRKKKDELVEYKVYSAQALTVAESDSFAPILEQNEKERQRLREKFKKVRRVPFFFGPKPDDWEWYKRSVEAAEELYVFEQEHGRPLYDSARRITEKEMSVGTVDCSYSDLEVRITELSHQDMEIPPTEDIQAYYDKRSDCMRRFKDASGEMKKEMVKLGYFYNLAWISLLLSLAFALCYAFHFFYDGFLENPLWIGASLIVSLLAFGLGAFFSRRSIKQKLEDLYYQMDQCCNKMGEDLSAFLNQVSKRKELQKEADIRRRNLAEMQGKMEAFHRHNLQIDRWETYFERILRHIEDTMDLLHVSPSSDPIVSEGKIDASVFSFDEFPSVPDIYRKTFMGETIVGDKKIDAVLSFVRRFDFTKYSGK